MARFAVDIFDVLLGLLRPALPGVTVRTKQPDNVPSMMPLVLLQRVGGSSAAPRFFDTPLITVQCWAESNQAASDLADAVRRVLWTAYRTQQVVPDVGWIGLMRESSGPLDMPDPDLPFAGRYVATYELRVRSAG